jgi:signal recognition particle subunit SRP54
LVACDIYRPAAIDQLEILSAECGAGFFGDRIQKDVTTISLEAVRKAKSEGYDVIVIDTAGRHQIDNDMVMELVRLRQLVSPDEIILVADAALGQESVSVAKHFNDALGLSGVILSKLDGDARGGAALSIRKITNSPIKFVGTGEKISDIEAFYPDRMASRILGMGDIVSLVEKAATEMDRKEAEKAQQRLLEQKFDMNDLLQQFKQMKKMGGVASIISHLPGADKLSQMPEIEDKTFHRMEAIISSMTAKERQKPETIDFPRKKRIAKGSGASLEDINNLLKQFDVMRKMMKSTSLMKKLMSGISSGSLLNSLSGGGGGLRRGSNYTPPKKKRKR